MDDDVTTTTTGGAQPQTTIIERRGGGSGTGLIIGLILLVALAIGAVYLFQQGKNDAIRTDAVSDAAKSVEKTADKAGDAIDKATGN